jgi:translation initiation factor IF-2
MAGKILIRDLAQSMGKTINEILFILKNFGINKISGEDELSLDEAQSLLSGDVKVTQKSVIIREDKKEKFLGKRKELKKAPVISRAASTEAPILNIPVKKGKAKGKEESEPASAPPPVPAAPSAAMAPPSAGPAARPAMFRQMVAPPTRASSLVKDHGRVAIIPDRPKPPPRVEERKPPRETRPAAGPTRKPAGPAPAAAKAKEAPAAAKPKPKKEEKKPPVRKKGKTPGFAPEPGVAIDLQQLKGRASHAAAELHEVTAEAKERKKGVRKTKKGVEEEIIHIPLSLKEQVTRLKDQVSKSGEVVMTEGQTVRNLMDKLGVKVKDFMAYFMDRGLNVSINQPLNQEFAERIGADLGFQVRLVGFEENIAVTQKEQREKKGEPRPPIVTVMGHVDHGKTTLLDTIRKARVAASEEGGITQHVGAYEVAVSGKKIVFVDTPGHEAFTFMRARGAQVTDIVILVVAADDGLMPQTLEAINHAKAAGVPILVAINKIDKGNANVEMVYKQLNEKGLQPEAWGGQTVTVPISALKGDGVHELLEMILLMAEMLDLRADPKGPAKGVVLESRKDVGRGVLATLILQEGTLKRGDIFIAGATWGKVRAMVNDHGQPVKEAPPGSALELMGFEDIPLAGDTFVVVEDEGEARKVVDYRQAQAREERLKGRVVSIEELLMKDMAAGKKVLSLVLKADTNGTLQVLKSIVKKLENEDVEILMVHEGVGAISRNDIMLASASKAMVIGFNIRPEKKAQDLAKQEEVEVRLYTVVFNLVDELSLLVSGMVEPKYTETVLGQAKVKKVFKIPKSGVIAGCEVSSGLIKRNALARLLRDSAVVHEGRISSLKRFQDDANEVREGQECGISLERYSDIKDGDVIEAFEKQKV